MTLFFNSDWWKEWETSVEEERKIYGASLIELKREKTGRVLCACLGIQEHELSPFLTTQEIQDKTQIGLMCQQCEDDLQTWSLEKNKDSQAFLVFDSIGPYRPYKILYEINNFLKKTKKVSRAIFANGEEIYFFPGKALEKKEIIQQVSLLVGIEQAKKIDYIFEKIPF